MNLGLFFSVSISSSFRPPLGPVFYFYCDIVRENTFFGMVRPFMQELLNVITLNGNELWGIIAMSITVSGTAVVLGALAGIPMGTWLGLRDFPAKRMVMRLVFTLMALPPVLAGLVVYLLLSRSGPLGSMEWLFTPQAMISAQFLLVTPIIAGLTASAVASRERVVHDLARSLGATSFQAGLTVLRESRTAIISAILTGFGRAFAEVGAVMLVGGNIRYDTRVLTTSIVMETRAGNYAFAIALGLILLLISFIVSSVALRLADELQAE